MDWKWIAGYEGLYQVSDHGHVKSFVKSKNGRELKPIVQATGYLAVSLYKDGRAVIFNIHRLVAEAFIPNPEEKPTVNHKFGVTTDNRASELEWATYGENNAHAYKTGLRAPAYDPQVFTFKHPELGLFTGTKHQFYTTHNLHDGHVSALASGKTKQHKGWIVT